MARATAPATGAQTGDLLLFHGNAIMQRLIQYFDESKWNHCAHLIGADDLAEIDSGVPVGVKSLKAKIQNYGAPGQAYGGVFRLKTVQDGSLTGMQPLVDSTTAIIVTAPHYGYDAIVLLFLLSITKKIPSVPWWGRALVTLLGKRAAGFLLDLEHNGKAPLICSAFCHLAYDSVTTDHDKFEIAVPEFRAAMLTSRLVQKTVVLRPEPGSILAEHMKTRTTASRPGFRRSQLPVAALPTDSEINAAGAEFLKKSAGRKPARPARAASVLSENDDLARSIETVLQFYPAITGGAKLAAIGGEARLISPGDLSVSDSLQLIGTLATDMTFTPA